MNMVKTWVVININTIVLASSNWQLQLYFSSIEYGIRNKIFDFEQKIMKMVLILQTYSSNFGQIGRQWAPILINKLIS